MMFVYVIFNDINKLNLFTITDYHPLDLERVKSDNKWIVRFIAHAEKNMETALTLLCECCQWRKDFGTNGKISS